MTAEHAAFVQGGQGSAGVVFIPHDSRREPLRRVG